MLIFASLVLILHGKEARKNSNGLLRERFPKETDLAKVTQKESNYDLNAINQNLLLCFLRT